jgi:hypothetical protein
MKKNTVPLLDINCEDYHDKVPKSGDSRASSPAFSYFSIASSKVKETPGFSSVFSCMKSSLRWKASLLNKRERIQARAYRRRYCVSNNKHKLFRARDHRVVQRVYHGLSWGHSYNGESQGDDEIYSPR